LENAVDTNFRLCPTGAGSSRDKSGAGTRDDETGATQRRRGTEKAERERRRAREEEEEEETEALAGMNTDERRQGKAETLFCCFSCFF
jgi:hypothetical protein